MTNALTQFSPVELSRDKGELLRYHRRDFAGHLIFILILSFGELATEGFEQLAQTSNDHLYALTVFVDVDVLNMSDLEIHDMQGRKSDCLGTLISTADWSRIHMGHRVASVVHEAHQLAIGIEYWISISDQHKEGTREAKA